ncbi:MAG: hypothetical protein LUC18_02965 [Porphyromonadaceae bacterium]|nr:hypothetical protein [Porphyromonadaceae bacterium]
MTDKLKENGFVSTKGLSGWQEQQLQAAVRKDEAIRLKNGVYADIDALTNTMVNIRMIVPGGILCLWSAWSVYNLTTRIPDAYYVAIERTRKIVLPDYPEFQPVYQSDKLLSIGATRKFVQRYDVPIFDLERSVCDAVKYRKKVGIDVMAEILQTYLKRPDKNISLLMNYASKLRIRNTLDQYLEVWQ